MMFLIFPVDYSNKANEYYKWSDVRCQIGY